jgi:dCTP deaminase
MRKIIGFDKKRSMRHHVKSSVPARHLTFSCAAETAAALRQIAREKQAPVSALIASGLADYLGNALPVTERPTPSGPLVSVGTYIDPGLARNVRARLAEANRTMPWLLHQIAMAPPPWVPTVTSRAAPSIPLGLLPDWAIRRLALEHHMIDPFVAELVRPVGPSYGLGSAGYDIRLAPELLVATGNGIELDAHVPSEDAFIRTTGDRLALPPHGFALGRSVETFRIPRDVLGLAVGKSTLARLGVHILVTPLEPGWHGTLTIELANLTSHPAVVYANEGITQVLFTRIPAPEVSYADRHGLYQHQTGITLARAATGHARRAYLPDPDE